jgi:hypothetical protein
MSVGFLTSLTVLAAEATASGSLFDQLAARFRAGKGGMYPIAICGVVALAIISDQWCLRLPPINKMVPPRAEEAHLRRRPRRRINYVAGQKTRRSPTW